MKPSATGDDIIMIGDEKPSVYWYCMLLKRYTQLPITAS